MEARPVPVEPWKACGYSDLEGRVHVGRRNQRTSSLLTALAALALGCSAQQAAEPEASPPVPAGAADVRVTDVALGTAVGLDKKVLQPVDVFHPEDTVYVSVVTAGTSSNTLLTARWQHDGRVLDETTQAIAPAGSANSEFHVSKPGGFEAGQYEVEILVEGKPVEKRRFTVQ
jgi:hypothetical protein